VSEQPAGLSPEDAKIVLLARAARARAGTPEGAAVRDANGRTYAAVTVSLPSLRLSALEVAVAMAVASGAGGLEAAAVVTGHGPVAEPEAPVGTDLDGVGGHDLGAVRDLGGAGLPVFVAAADGSVRSVLRT